MIEYEYEETFSLCGITGTDWCPGLQPTPSILLNELLDRVFEVVGGRQVMAKSKKKTRAKKSPRAQDAKWIATAKTLARKTLDFCNSLPPDYEATIAASKEAYYALARAVGLLEVTSRY